MIGSKPIYDWRRFSNLNGMSPTVAAYSISRNEGKHAARWAEATKDADYRLVLDTGSTDDTVAILRAAGVTVVQAGFAEDEPSFAYGGDALLLPGRFRFDVARNAALDLVPADVDLCASIDLDEICDPGFFDAIRETFAHQPAATKLRAWFHTGGWWRCDRVHSRHGFRWKYPCHEVTEWQGPGMELQVDVEATMRHWPDNSKPRDYIPLLDLYVEEHPSEARGWVYLCRQHHYGGDYVEVLRCASHVLACLDGWDVEKAATCRLAALAATALGHDDAHVRNWWERGTMEAPREAEAWGGLCSYWYAKQDWAQLLVAAERGMTCPQTTHYIADQALRAWGVLDYAALACHQMALASATPP